MAPSKWPARFICDDIDEEIKTLSLSRYSFYDDDAESIGWAYTLHSIQLNLDTTLNGGNIMYY